MLCGGLELETGFLQNSINNVLFPCRDGRIRGGPARHVGLGDMRTIDLLVKLPFKLISVGISNGNKHRTIRWRRMSISVLGITTIDTVIHLGSEGEEESLDWLFNT